MRSNRTLRLIRSSLDGFGIDTKRFEEPNYLWTQEIGAAVAFVGCDGLIVPSARRACDNLVLFTDNLAMDIDIRVKETEEVNWQEWARSAGML